MATTWEDVQRDLWYEAQMEEIEREIAGRKMETTGAFISEGFTNSEDITSRIVTELSKLVSADHSQSIGFLIGSLLETLERETIALPLLVSGLGLNETNIEKNAQIKKMISKGVDSPNFTYKFFEDIQRDITGVKAHFDRLVTTMLPGHQLFKVEGGLWAYRERVQSFRNYVVHGRSFATTDEADYIVAFASNWRDLVYNVILAKFKLKLDGQWHLQNL